MTHTYAILDLSPRAYGEIAAKLQQAGYHEAFHEDDGRTVVDMHGIAVAREKADKIELTETASIEIGTFVSARTQRGGVSFSLNDLTTQFDLDKAREVLKMLQEAVEAAISDELIFHFLVDKIGLDKEKAGHALLDFREMRQGTRGTSHAH